MSLDWPMMMFVAGFMMAVVGIRYRRTVPLTAATVMMCASALGAVIRPALPIMPGTGDDHLMVVTDGPGKWSPGASEPVFVDGWSLHHEIHDGPLPSERRAASPGRPSQDPAVEYWSLANDRTGDLNGDLIHLGPAPLATQAGVQTLFLHSDVDPGDELTATVDNAGVLNAHCVNVAQGPDDSGPAPPWWAFGIGGWVLMLLGGMLGSSITLVLTRGRP